MRIVILILFLAGNITALRAQQANGTYKFSQVGWTITLPDEFIIMDSAASQAKMERGLKAIEEANNITGDISGTIVLISATKNTYNYFNASLETFNPAVDGSFHATNQQLKELTYSTLADRMQDAEMDTATTAFSIDNISFDKFTIRINLSENFAMTMVMLTKYYKGYIFGITYLYLDDKTKEQIENMLQTSKFEK